MVGAFRIFPKLTAAFAPMGNSTFGWMESSTQMNLSLRNTGNETLDMLARLRMRGARFRGAAIRGSTDQGTTGLEKLTLGKLGLESSCHVNLGQGI